MGFKIAVISICVVAVVVGVVTVAIAVIVTALGPVVVIFEGASAVVVTGTIVLPGDMIGIGVAVVVAIDAAAALLPVMLPSLGVTLAAWVEGNNDPSKAVESETKFVIAFAEVGFRVALM